MSEIVDQLERAGVVPVITAEPGLDAGALGRALVQGGLPIAEITLRTEAGLAAIKQMADDVPDMLVGAGTVLRTEQVAEAIMAGARFIVAPGLNGAVVEECLAHNIPIFPGVCTPSEIEAALEMGLTILKFFPAQPMGGIATLRAIGAPYPMVRFMPTGGINPQNLADYLALGNVVACGGSWMVPTDAVAAGDYDKIADLAATASTIVKAARA